MAAAGFGGGWLSLVGGIVKSVGNRYDAYETQKQLKQEARLKERAAEDTLAIGLLKADQVRKQGRLALGSARGDYAAAGVTVGAGGSVEAVEQDIQVGVEKDAMLTIFNSQTEASALRAEAKQLRRNATNTQVKATFENISTVLGS